MRVCVPGGMTEHCDSTDAGTITRTQDDSLQKRWKRLLATFHRLGFGVWLNVA